MDIYDWPDPSTWFMLKWMELIINWNVPHLVAFKVDHECHTAVDRVFSHIFLKSIKTILNMMMAAACSNVRNEVWLIKFHSVCCQKKGY